LLICHVAAQWLFHSMPCNDDGDDGDGDDGDGDDEDDVT
jgi:hypothetical protein